MPFKGLLNSKNQQSELIQVYVLHKETINVLRKRDCVMFLIGFLDSKKQINNLFAAVT